MSFIQEMYDDVTENMQPWFKHTVGVPVTAFILTVCAAAAGPLLITMGISYLIETSCNWAWKHFKKLFFKEKETKYNERF